MCLATHGNLTHYQR